MRENPPAPPLELPLRFCAYVRTKTLFTVKTTARFRAAEGSVPWRRALSGPKIAVNSLIDQQRVSVPFYFYLFLDITYTFQPYP